MSKVKTETQNSPVQRSKALLLPSGHKVIDLSLWWAKNTSQTDLFCLTQQRLELYKPKFTKESQKGQTVKQSSQSLLTPMIIDHKKTKVKTKSKFSRKEK